MLPTITKMGKKNIARSSKLLIDVKSLQTILFNSGSLAIAIYANLNM